MLKNIRTKMQDDKGFTLIELMVVVLIIAILIAIAIPTFLGLRRRAQDRAAQSDLRNTLTNAKAFFADTEDYSTVTAAALTAQEPSLTFVDAATASASGNNYAVSVNVGQTNIANDTFSAARLSASNMCFWIKDIGTTNPSVGGTFYGSGGTCTGTAAMAAAAPKW
jgi:type IV pilus assembly protein PilA